MTMEIAKGNIADFMTAEYGICQKNKMAGLSCHRRKR